MTYRSDTPFTTHKQKHLKKKIKINLNQKCKILSTREIKRKQKKPTNLNSIPTPKYKNEILFRLGVVKMA